MCSARKCRKLCFLSPFSSSDHPFAESGVSTPSQPTTDSGFRSQATDCTYPTPTPSYQAINTPISSYLDSSSPASSYLGTTTPTLSYLGPNTILGSYAVSDPSPTSSEPFQDTLSHGSPHTQRQMNSLSSTQGPLLQQHSNATQDMSIMSQYASPANGFQVGMPGLGGSPVLGRRLSQGAQSSPVLGRQASLGQGSQQSPVLSRQPSLGQPLQSSPVLSRQPSVTYPQGSPVLGRHPSVSQMSQRSPSLDRHPMHSGYTTPDERHGNLSRQSSSSGYQGPPTPSFPISPAGYQDGGMMGMGAGFRQGSPAPGFQPQLPEKRRMSSGDRPNGALSYGTLNGKMTSPMSGGNTPSYFHTLSDFSRFNMHGKNAQFMDYSKLILVRKDKRQREGVGLVSFRSLILYVLSDWECFLFFSWFIKQPPNWWQTLCDILSVFVADGVPDSRLNVKFVQDTSKFWYKPDISREQGTTRLFLIWIITIVPILLRMNCELMQPLLDVRSTQLSLLASSINGSCVFSNIVNEDMNMQRKLVQWLMLHG